MHQVKKISLIQQLRDNPFVLAPMAGITDVAFRSFMKEMGASVVITELVSANGLAFGSEKTKKLMEYDEIQRPIGVQLFGDNLDHLRDAAVFVEQEIGADFVDLNFGCPVPKVVKKGGGSAILKDLDRLATLLNLVKGAIEIPLTIKIRTGWDQPSRNSDEVCKIAYNEGVEWVGIHGRTRSQGYQGDADWDYIKAIAEKVQIPILGNGDIKDPQTAISRTQEFFCHGVMIGRGCLKDPFLFTDALSLLSGEVNTSEKNFHFIFNRLKYYLEKHFDEKKSALQLKKMAAWYSSGYKNSAQFRKDLFRESDYQVVNRCVDEYFQSLDESLRQDTTGEAFLMGGHG